MSKEQVLTLGIVAGFMVVFPLFWCLVIWIISFVGGWRTLAGSFAASSEPVGDRYSWRALRIAPAANYNGCINVVLSSGGIYMVPSMLFRFAHEPLLLPWDCLVQVSERRFLGRRLWVSLLAKGKKLTLMLPPSAEEAIRRYSGKQFPQR